jgi:hypothetical protein
MELTMVRFTIAATLLAGAGLFGDLILSTGVARAEDAKSRVTFQHDVLPILAKRCQQCHSPGKIAPMSFVTYKATQPWAPKIKALVTDKKMPPVVGTPHFTVLTQGEGLTQAEITTLVTWVDIGAPEGVERDAKPKSSSQGSKK